MAQVPDDIKKDLKKPLGRLGKPEELRDLSRAYRVIAVGDISVIKCLENGVRPFIAVFDLFYMRKPLEPEMRALLEDKFPQPVRVTNPQGSITEDFLSAAKSLLAHGGAIRVTGEEDLTALAMIAICDSRSAVVYGQPNEGLVFVEPDEKVKAKAMGILRKLGLID